MTITQRSTRLAALTLGVAAVVAVALGAALATPAQAATICPGTTWGVNLKIGSTGADVMKLQQFLNMASDTQIAASGIGSAGMESSYYGALTGAAVKKFQLKYATQILAPLGLTTPTTNFFGSSRAQANTLCAGGTVPPGPVTPPVTGNGLKVMLATDSPNNTALVQGQAAGDLAHFTLSNPTSAPVMVTNIAFKRTGVSNDSTMSNVYLYNGAVRLTDSAGVSNSAFNFNNPSGLFTVPAGGTYTVSVRSDIAGSTSGQQIGVQLVSVASNGTLDSSVVFPINGYLQTISAATLATVDFNTTTLPSVSTVDPQVDYTVWQNTMTVGTRAVTLRSFALRNIGSIQNGDLKNFRLYVDGVNVGSAVPLIDATTNMITFDLSANPVRLETGGRVVKVLADIVGGASRTFDFSLRYPGDALMIDTDLGQGVLPTANGSTFSARTATSATINSVSSSAPSVTRATDSPTANVSVGSTNVKWASFKLLANGEDVKVESLNVSVDTSVHNGGLDNGKVFLNGVQVGSTKDLVDSTDVNFTFGSSMILKAGTVAVVDIYADAKTSTSTSLSNNETVAVSLTAGSSNGQGQISLSSVNVPTGTVSGNTITVTSASLTASKASGYGNQTIVAGSQNAKIGSFTLSTGSTEGVNINTIEIGFASAVSSTITDLMLKDSATGNAIGTAKSTIGTTNSFSVSIDIPASGTKTVDVYANVKTGANAGPLPSTTVTTNTGGTSKVNGTTVSVGTAPTLQTITVGSATLTAAVNTGNTPDSMNVVAGNTSVKVGAFRFTAQNSGFTVDKVAVKIPANAATYVSNVMLKYKDVNGADQVSSQALTLSSGAQTYATSSFSGLTFYVPMNVDRDLEVWVQVASVANVHAIPNAAISAVLDADEGFNATDSSGAADTSLNASDLSSAATTGKGTLYVRQSLPTISAVALESTVLNNGSNKALGRVKITADAAGSVSWKKIVFTINKTAAVTLGATSTIALWNGSNQVTGTFATTTGDFAAQTQAFTTAATTGSLVFEATTEQEIGAGSSATYELRGTVGGVTTGYNFVDVSIANTSTSVTTAAYSTIHTATGDSSESFIWSDRSASVSTTHSESTADWTNDYLIKTLPTTLSTVWVSI